MKADALSHEVIAAAIEVHRDKGPGLNEGIYEWCMGIELELRGIASVNQKQVKIIYKGFVKEEPLRFDLLANDCLLVEAKSVEHILPVHKAQILTYMKLLNVPIGLLINFNVSRLIDGLHRLILPGANQKARRRLRSLRYLSRNFNWVRDFFNHEWTRKNVTTVPWKDRLNLEIEAGPCSGAALAKPFVSLRVHSWLKTTVRFTSS